jgi:hypothetical protein
VFGIKQKISSVKASLLPEKGEMYQGDGPCHYFLLPAAQSMVRKTKILGVVTHSTKDLSNYTSIVAYYDWLLNRSLLRDCYITKKAEVAAKHGVIQRIDLEANLFLFAAQLARWPWTEYEIYVEPFDRLVKDGYKLPWLLQLALVTSGQLCLSNDKLYWVAGAQSHTSHSLFGTGTSHHLPWSVQMNYLGGLKNLCRSELQQGFQGISFLKGRKLFGMDSSICVKNWDGYATKLLLGEINGEIIPVRDYHGKNQTRVGGRTEEIEPAYQYFWEQAVSQLPSSNKASISKISVDLPWLENFVAKNNITTGM